MTRKRRTKQKAIVAHATWDAVMDVQVAKLPACCEVGGCMVQACHPHGGGGGELDANLLGKDQDVVFSHH